MRSSFTFQSCLMTVLGNLSWVVGCVQGLEPYEDLLPVGEGQIVTNLMISRNYFGRLKEFANVTHRPGCGLW